jgi:hypothetical protein
MPPQYKPLASPFQGTPGASSGAFTTAPVDFQDAEKTQLAIQAQELANQINSVNAQKTQRQFTQDTQMQDALSSQFGGQDNFNPDEALQLAQSIAIKNGDLDQALKIEQVTRARGMTTVPLTPERKQLFEQQLGIPLPDGITMGDLTAMSQMQKAKTYSDSVNETIDKRSDSLASLAPGNFEAAVDPATGQGPTTVDGKLFTKTAVTHARLNSDLDNLEAALRDSGGNDPTHPQFQVARAIMSDIQIALKEKNGFGAVLSPGEERLNNASLPEVFARADMGAGQALVAAGLGRDPIQAINTLRSLLSTDFDQQMTLYKFRPKQGATGLPAAQSGTSFRMPSTNSVAPAAPAPQQTQSILPRRQDGQPLSKEEFMANMGGGI